MTLLPDAWVIATLCAASFQTFRFLLQKTLTRGGLSATGATFARFVFALPVLFIALQTYASITGQSLPSLASNSFWVFAAFGAVTQILATICVVALFSLRNFAVGITFKKTEVLLSVPVGLVLLGEGVGPYALLAILIGLGGVLLLSDPPKGASRGIFNRAAGLGLLSGLLFAMCGVFYRGATLQVLSDDALMRAGVSLSVVVAMQFAGLGLWLALRDPAQIRAVIANWRVTLFTGLSSAAGSLSWFTAFALQTVAVVSALGQIEVILSLLVGWLWFGERTTRREIGGIALLGVSIVLLLIAV